MCFKPILATASASSLTKPESISQSEVLMPLYPCGTFKPWHALGPSLDWYDFKNLKKQICGGGVGPDNVQNCLTSFKIALTIYEKLILLFSRKTWQQDLLYPCIYPPIRHVNPFLKITI
jgi:hypothetical protein